MRTLIKTSLISFLLLAPAVAFADDPPRDDMGQSQNDMNDTSQSAKNVSERGAISG